MTEESVIFDGKEDGFSMVCEYPLPGTANGVPEGRERNAGKNL